MLSIEIHYSVHKPDMIVSNVGIGWAVFVPAVAFVWLRQAWGLLHTEVTGHRFRRVPSPVCHTDPGTRDDRPGCCPSDR